MRSTGSAIKWVRRVAVVLAVALLLGAGTVAGLLWLLRSLHESASEDAIGQIRAAARLESDDLRSYLQYQSRVGADATAVMNGFPTEYGRTLDAGQQGDTFYWDVRFIEEGRENGPTVLQSDTLLVRACVRFSALVREDPVVEMTDCTLPADDSGYGADAPVVQVFE